MKKFLDENFLLNTKTAQQLYHEYAKGMPIIDYHCHLPPDQIAADLNFSNLTQAWLYGDHYKWRAMRTNGVDESYCTGNQPDFEKFRKWAATVPFTLRNPLYHWTHLELQRYFGIHQLLNAESAEKIYEECSAKLQTPQYSIRNLLRRMNVKVVCTTDDPVDSLEHHRRLKEDTLIPDKQGFDIRILPAYRPDKAMNVDDASAFNTYLGKLESVTNTNIVVFSDYLDALKSRHDFFASMGCSVSDHGLEQIYADDYTDTEIAAAFAKIRSGKE
ncbi:MAG TPA: glucuronate isomerase, partial [Flavisolibacter sp.]|nr:glucuronate isomerase [Flavisolibacter sp.]